MTCTLGTVVSRLTRSSFLSLLNLRIDARAAERSQHTERCTCRSEAYAHHSIRYSQSNGPSIRMDTRASAP